MSLYFGADPSRLGLKTLAGSDNRELFLKVFGGEVITAFNDVNVMMPLHTVRTIASGKSAQFPRIGRAVAKYHVSGEDLLTAGVDTSSPADGTADETKYLNKIAHSEKIIHIDELLTASTFLSNLDEAMNHYDVRSQYSMELGYALSETADKNLIRTVIAGARATTNVFGTAAANAAAQAADRFLGGQIVVDGTASGNQIVADKAGSSTATFGEQLISALFKAAELMDKKNVPKWDRFCVLDPAHYYSLIDENKDAINRDYGNDGNGSVARGEIVSVAGIRLIPSNHVPNSDEGAVSNIHNDAGVINDPYGSGGVGYGGADYSDTCGIVFQKGAIGTVKLLDLAVESEYLIRNQGHLMVAKYAMGHGILREECCFELVDTAGTVGVN